MFTAPTRGGGLMETLEAYDSGLLYWFESLHRPWLTPVVKALTHLGDFALLGPLALVMTFGFVLARRPRLAAGFALICLSALGLEYGVKYLVRRPRPDVAWRLIPLPKEPSFPSGHSLCAMTIYPAWALLVGRLIRRRWLAGLLVGLCVLIGLVVGLTRPYLGVHYPMDMVAGWCGGLGLALVGAWLVGRWDDQAQPPGVPAPVR
jgi:undecaprenyl-diphosphatase